MALCALPGRRIGHAIALILLLAGCTPGADYSHCKPEDFQLFADRTAVCVRYSIPPR